MAKDDYHVIVYQILAYLYGCLKNGEDVDPELLESDAIIANINERYRLFILETLQNRGYIEGVVFKRIGKDIAKAVVDNCRITPEGIEYLCDNSFMQKALDFLKDVKAIIPFA